MNAGHRGGWPIAWANTCTSRLPTALIFSTRLGAFKTPPSPPLKAWKTRA